MREIKFRGMDANGVMRYGRLSQDKPDTTVYFKEYSQRICWDNSNIPVSNKSLGQFTGLLDRNDKEIYEGDIVKDINHDNKADIFTGEVKFEWGKWHIGSISLFNLLDVGDVVEIIGNIYENPELLK